MNVLIVGLGSMGKRRARLLKKLNAGHKVYGVDNSADRCVQAEELGITAFQSIPEATEKIKFECAFVCTAPLTHAIIINDLLDENMHVFTELNLVDDGYESLIQKAKEKGLVLFLSSTMLYRAETRFITREVQKFKNKGKKVNYIYHIGQYLPDWHPWENYKDFFVGNKRTGGIREIFAVDLPWLICAFGNVEDIYVQSDKLSSLDIDYNDSWLITLKHEDGTKGVLAADIVCPKAVRNFEVYGEGLHLFWEGNPQSLYKFNCEAKEKIYIDTYANVEQLQGYSDNIIENVYTEEILNFFDVIAGIAKPEWSFEKDLEVIKLMDKIEYYGETQAAKDKKEKLDKEAKEAVESRDDIDALETIDNYQEFKDE